MAKDSHVIISGRNFNQSLKKSSIFNLDFKLHHCHIKCCVSSESISICSSLLFLFLFIYSTDDLLGAYYMSCRESGVYQSQNPGSPGVYILVWKIDRQADNQPTNQPARYHIFIRNNKHEEGQSYGRRSTTSDKRVREGFSEGMSRILNVNSWGNVFLAERSLRANTPTLGICLGVLGIARRLQKSRKQMQQESSWKVVGI